MELGFPVGVETEPTPPRHLLTPTPEPCRRRVDSQSDHRKDRVKIEISSSSEPSSPESESEAESDSEAEATTATRKQKDASDTDRSEGQSNHSSTSGNGYTMATTPSLQSDISEEGTSITPTVKETSEDESLAFNHSPWWSDSEEERYDKALYYGLFRLDGGGKTGNAEGTDNHTNASQDITQAVKMARKTNTRLSKKQLLIIFRMEPRTLRRTLNTQDDQQAQQRLEQILCAAAKRMTFVIPEKSTTAASSRKMEGKTDVMQPQETNRQGNRQGPSARPQQEQGNDGKSTNGQGQTHTNGKPGKGKGTGASQPTGKSAAQDSSTTEKTFRLIPAEWPFEVHNLEGDLSNLRTDQDGIYMVDSESLAQKAEYMMTGATGRIALITPRKWCVGRCEPIESMATVMTTTVRTKGRERNTSTMRASIQIWIYNITATKAIETSPRPVLALAGDRLTTTVLRMRIPMSNIPESLRNQSASEIAKAELDRLLGPKQYVDAWGARQGEHEEILVLVRVLATQKGGLLQRSGMEDFWVDTPREDMQEQGPVWLAPPKTKQSLQEARDMVRGVEKHGGMVVKYHQHGESYALRIPHARIQEVQKQLKIETRQTFTITNVPPHLGQTDLQEIIGKVGWDAQVTGVREWVRGQAAWKVTSENEPTHSCFQVQIGYERHWLKVLASRKPQPKREPIMPATRSPPETWAQAAQGTKARRASDNNGRETGRQEQKTQDNPRGKATGAGGPEGPYPKRARVGTGKEMHEETMPRVIPTQLPMSGAQSSQEIPALRTQVTQLADAVMRMEQLLAQHFPRPDGTQRQPQTPVEQAQGQVQAGREDGRPNGGNSMDVDGGGTGHTRERSPRRPNQE